jgi:hypothetical protein
MCTCTWRTLQPPSADFGRSATDSQPRGCEFSEIVGSEQGMALNSRMAAGVSSEQWCPMIGIFARRWSANVTSCTVASSEVSHFILPDGMSRVRPSDESEVVEQPQSRVSRGVPAVPPTSTSGQAAYLHLGRMLVSLRERMYAIVLMHMRYGHHRLNAMLTQANKSSQQLPLQSNLKILRLTLSLSRHRRSYHIKMTSPMQMQNLDTAGVIRPLCRGTKHPPPCSCSDYLLTVYAVRICDTDASDARGWPATLRTYAAKASSTSDRCEYRAQATHRFGVHNLYL